MGATRFQLGLITALSIALGHSLASKTASSYPAGAAVSYGANPLWTFGGDTSTTASVAAPEEHDMVITDLIIMPSYGVTDIATISLSDGTTLGKFYLQSYSSIDRHVAHSFAGGIRIPRGQTMTLTSTGIAYYSISGYYAHP
jgi:hypothetical protein